MYRQEYSSIITPGRSNSCKICGSTTNRKYIFFGKILGCINPECPNFEYNTKKLRKEKLKRLKNGSS